MPIHIHCHCCAIVEVPSQLHTNTHNLGYLTHTDGDLRECSSQKVALKIIAKHPRASIDLVVLKNKTLKAQFEHYNQLAARVQTESQITLPCDLHRQRKKKTLD
jgi:hypothetical protein